MDHSTAKFKVLISHTHDEKKLAEAWKKLLEVLAGELIEAWYSSDEDPVGGVRPGQAWEEDLEKRLATYDVLLAIQTPKSENRAWIFWETGIFHGVLLKKRKPKPASTTEHIHAHANKYKERGIIPIMYWIKRGELLNPLNVYQTYEGEDEKQIRQVCEYLMELANLPLTDELFARAFLIYLDTVHDYEPPQPVTKELMAKWEKRFQGLAISEVAEMRIEMYASLATPFEPIDAEIHGTLSRLLLKEKHFQEALQEINYALSLDKTDLAFLLLKAQVLVGSQEYQQAEEIIKQRYVKIPGLQQHTEWSSLEGRIHRERWAITQEPAELDAAIEAYRRPYQVKTEDYYPAINLAELLLTRGREEDLVQAATAFKDILKTCQFFQRPPDASFWIDFTLGTAYIGLGRVPEALIEFQKGLARPTQPSLRERESALNGALRMAKVNKLTEESMASLQTLLLLS